MINKWEKSIQIVISNWLSCWQFSVSPLELAIETIDESNQKIKSQIDQHIADPSLKVDPLGMILNGVVDAAVNGGIANYKVSIYLLLLI